MRLRIDLTQKELQEVLCAIAWALFDRVYTSRCTLYERQALNNAYNKLVAMKWRGLK